ncbi:MAG TPA: NAD(P)H-binding protein, partial [Methylomirabilota bacterium]|nr:NAD(P)H-binding protein [Methylomirabilota bacterium]
MPAKIVAIAGGSGFIGRAIARRLAAIGDIKVRVITRNPDAAYERLKVPGVEFVRGDIADPATLKDSLAGASAIVDAVQFDGYPIEDPRRGLTFERVDYGGAVTLIEAAKQAGVAQFVYISGASADEYSAHPGFCAKGRAERAIRDSGLT